MIDNMQFKYAKKKTQQYYLQLNAPILIKI